MVAQLFARPAARSELIRRVRKSFGPNRDLQFTLTNIRLKDIFREASNRASRPARSQLLGLRDARIRSPSTFVPRIGASGMSHSNLVWLVLVFQRGRQWELSAGATGGIPRYYITRRDGANDGLSNL